MDDLLRLAVRQDGLLTLAQIDAAGHRGLFRRRLRSGEWVVRQPRVVGAATAAPEFA